MLQPANPILRGMYPDPSICRVDDLYYLVTSTFEYLPGLPVHVSRDLVEWRLVGHAIDSPHQFDYAGVGDSRGLFAPTIRHHDGLFYIACTLMVGEAARNFYVTSDAPEGPWSQPVILPDARGIDPSLFFHEGRVWWIGCREVAEQSFEGETEVWMRELDLERGALVGDERVIWTRTMARAVWAEAPHLYHRDGWFYLVTAEGGTAFEHSVMIARSRELAGPYLPCPRNPVLTHRHLGHGAPVQNVGHADLVDDTDGGWWLVALATRPVDGHHILGRETHLARVTWEDDWPVVNAGLGMLDAPVASPGRWGSEGAPAVGDFLTVRSFPTFAERDDRGTVLRSTGAPAALLRRLTSLDGTVTVTLDEIGAGAVAGLVLRQSDRTHVRLELRHGRAELVVSHDGDTLVAGVPVPAGRIELVARVSSDGVAWSAAGTDVGRTPLSALSTETAGGFVGTTFGPYVDGPRGASVRFIAWTQEDFG